jgi:pyruvate dehydrogenase E1 component alpha subunit/2-oxoisovalerate dehydrogenase E1 component alpha subunit
MARSKSKAATTADVAPLETQVSLDAHGQRELYRYMLLTRRLEEKLANFYRQGKIVGGLYRSLGQEATAVGSAYALGPDDFLAPLIRNLGSMLVRGVRPVEMMRQYMAKGDSPTLGKDLNNHFGDVAGRRLVAPISVLGSLVPVMGGIALAGRMRGEKIVALTYIGDGGMSTGEFYEGMNFAAVKKLALVIVAENNGFAYSTPTASQAAVDSLAQRAAGYGVATETVDGNDVLAVHEAARQAVERGRAGGGPTLIEARTFRMKGHAEHDDQRYVPRELLEEWAARDPLDRYRVTLLQRDILSEADLEEMEEHIRADLNAAQDEADASPPPPPERALEGVYHDAPRARNPRPRIRR